MTEIKEYRLSPTDLIPNSPRPLLHYRNVLSRRSDNGQCDATDAWQMFESNGWRVSWITRYAASQLSHYHSHTHECMAVLSGTATIRFGVADTAEDLTENTHGSAREVGGIELEAEAGDVFVIPAGVAHKTFNTRPAAEFKFLTPGLGHGIASDDAKKLISEIELTGFTMMGAYSNGDWDFVTSGGEYERVWSVSKPERDPVFGKSDEGLCKLWRGSTIGARVLKI